MLIKKQEYRLAFIVQQLSVKNIFTLRKSGNSLQSLHGFINPARSSP